MNANAFPLTAAVNATRAPTGLHAATVNIGFGEPRVFPGYLSRSDALAAGQRFALEGFGRRPVMPDDYAPAIRREATVAEIHASCVALAETLQAVRNASPAFRSGHRGDARRRARQTVRNAKHAFLDSI